MIIQLALGFTLSSNVFAPSITESGFNCPHCGAFAAQQWYKLCGSPINSGDTPFIINEHRLIHEIRKINKKNDPDKDVQIKYQNRLRNGDVFIGDSAAPSYPSAVNNLFIAVCHRCSNGSAWAYDKMVYPDSGFPLLPVEGMPDNVKTVFNEARSILHKSPRAASALARLCLEKLCHHLGANPSDTLNRSIGILVERGLPKRAQQVFDIVRVEGNDAIHAGTIQDGDTTEDAQTLLNLINLAVEKTITEPEKIDELYDLIPDGKKRYIEKRDEKP